MDFGGLSHSSRKSFGQKGKRPVGKKRNRTHCCKVEFLEKGKEISAPSSIANIPAACRASERKHLVRVRSSRHGRRARAVVVRGEQNNKKEKEKESNTTAREKRLT